MQDFAAKRTEIRALSDHLARELDSAFLKLVDEYIATFGALQGMERLMLRVLSVSDRCEGGLRAHLVRTAVRDSG
jgi:hypothetical protein